MVRDGASKGVVGAFPQLAPRGLRRPQAAAYVGVGPTKFGEMVGDGRMPPPKHVDGCVIWDRYALDQAFDALGEEDQLTAAKRKWSEAED